MSERMMDELALDLWLWLVWWGVLVAMMVMLMGGKREVMVCVKWKR